MIGLTAGNSDGGCFFGVRAERSGDEKVGYAAEERVGVLRAAIVLATSRGLGQGIDLGSFAGRGGINAVERYKDRIKAYLSA